MLNNLMSAHAPPGYKNPKTVPLGMNPSTSLSIPLKFHLPIAKTTFKEKTIMPPRARRYLSDAGPNQGTSKSPTGKEISGKRNNNVIEEVDIQRL